MTTDSELHRIAQDITYKMFGNAIAIGKYFRYSPNGKASTEGVPIKIISGYFLDPIYGRLSNHWRWKVVKKNGELQEGQDSGYGGGPNYFYPITEQEAIEIANASR